MWKKKDVVALFNCCGPVSMSGESSLAHEELTMEGRESQRENGSVKIEDEIPVPAEEKTGMHIQSLKEVQSQVKVGC